MSHYQNFIGIDIGKFTFVVAMHSNKLSKEYENNAKGIRTFLKDSKSHLQSSLVVLETTGGYEMELLLALCDKNFRVHRANTRKVKSFIRSFGNTAKTDSLDAKALALYGFERHDRLKLFTPVSKQQSTLYALVQRRKDLKQFLVAEKNRVKAPEASVVKNSCEFMIETLTDQITQITKQIEALINSDPTFLARAQVLKTIPGIGEITAQDLLALIPELGTLTRKQVASLAGVAPRANDSGKFHGYRHTGRGRDSIKPTLFLAAMAARNSHSHLKTFYDNLISRGKQKMVALTALMRKIIVIANAKLKPLATQTT
ncbi:MAG TPA: IS110 family transposase [Alphaproteobacteria bacterium]|nr:IS110 family transposase [Alphaproteobacteria bacterium]